MRTWLPVPAPEPTRLGEVLWLQPYPDHHVTGLYVIELAGDRICELTGFETSLAAHFGLPRTLE